MPREILTETDLPVDARVRLQSQRRRADEREQDPKALTVLERITRLETLLGVG